MYDKELIEQMKEKLIKFGYKTDYINNLSIDDMFGLFEKEFGSASIL